MPVDSRATLERFQQFIGKSRSLLSKTGSPSALRAFGQFVYDAKPLLLRDLPRRLAVLVSAKLRHVHRWLLAPEYDLLEVAGLTCAEDTYTDLMAWSLSPRTHPETALRRQQEWLRSLGIPEADSLTEPVEPEVQVFTDDGRPDMVLRYARFVLTVEAKTRSAEHRTPSGEPQSEAYPNAVRRKFGLPASFPVFMVFLTMDGTLPANQDAISTTYLNFAAALAAALAGAALPEELRFVFRLWISHLATCAVPGDLDVRHVVGQLISLFDEPRHEEMDGKILAALDDINSLLTLLPVRTEHE